jgi:hypothetical protein
MKDKQTKLREILKKIYYEGVGSAKHKINSGTIQRDDAIDQAIKAITKLSQKKVYD